VPEQGGERAAERARQRPGDDRRQHAGADEHGHRAEADEQDRRSGQPRDQEGDAGDRDDAAGRGTAPSGVDVALPLVDQSRHGWDAHRAPGRADRRYHGHADAHAERDDDVRASNTSGAEGSVIPNALSSALRPARPARPVPGR
jgi:hypothetical protein